MVTDYRRLLNRQQQLDNKLKNLQRERDLKVDAINSKYQFQIDKVMRDIDITKLMVNASKTFVKEN